MRISRTKWLGPALVAVSLVVAAPAAAKLYRCQLPDGRTSFTDNPAKCPNAQEHEPTGAVQSVPTTGSAVRRAPPASTRRSSLEERASHAEEGKWRQNKEQKQAELASLEERARYLQKFVSHCNRGGAVFAKDDTGIKHGVSCNSIDKERAQVDREIASVRAYLDQGIHDDCRRSGCLPGWLR